jgi:hypothetical protein
MKGDAMNFSRTKWLKYIFVAIVAAMALYFIIIFRSGIVDKRSILSKINSVVLLQKCRGLMSNWNTFKTNIPDSSVPRQSNPNIVFIYFDKPNVDQRIPEEIRKLNPVYLSISKNHVNIVLSAGFHNLIIRALAEGESDSTMGGAGEMMLVKGLWLVER